MSALKFCKDCRYVCPSETAVPSLEFARCLHPESLDRIPVNLVSGESGRPLYCSSMRQGACGIAASLFQPAARGQGGEG